MAASFALVLALSAVAGPGDRAALVELGGDPARGVLINLTPGAQAVDPSRPTVVFIHGLNPLPRTVHFTMAERFAESLSRRGGPAFNILSWNWNAATVMGLDSRVNEEGAVGQGWSLASSLWHAGVSPSHTHLIGHSHGSIVATSAARTLAGWHGQPIAHLTLLDPAAFYHDVVFDRLAAGSAARRVENFWTPGPSGYGRHVSYAGVWNTQINGPTPLFGAVWPLRSSHFHVVDWYIATAGDPSFPGGFNTSLLLASTR